MNLYIKKNYKLIILIKAENKSISLVIYKYNKKYKNNFFFLYKNVENMQSKK